MAFGLTAPVDGNSPQASPEKRSVSARRMLGGRPYRWRRRFLGQLVGHRIGKRVEIFHTVLAADVSRSIDDGEFELQRKGYAATLTDPRVLKATQATRNGTVAVCFVEWSGADDQQVALEWSEIRDAEDGGAVAAAILKAPRSFTGRTSRSRPAAAAQERRRSRARALIAIFPGSRRLRIAPAPVARKSLPPASVAGQAYDLAGYDY